MLPVNPATSILLGLLVCIGAGAVAANSTGAMRAIAIVIFLGGLVDLVIGLIWAWTWFREESSEWRIARRDLHRKDPPDEEPSDVWDPARSDD